MASLPMMRSGCGRQPACLHLASSNTWAGSSGDGFAGVFAGEDVEVIDTNGDNSAEVRHG